MNDIAMPSVLGRLAEATNAHDVDALAGCFAAGFVSETPAHPDRNFTGVDQVRRNWSMIFDAVPDLTASVTGWSLDGDTIWAEWEHRGTRRDGAPHDLRGVTIMRAGDAGIEWLRFYLEPVARDGLGASDAVRTVLTAGRPL
jgi:ketosteroid isomerase-like protein